MLTIACVQHATDRLSTVSDARILIGSVLRIHKWPRTAIVCDLSVNRQSGRFPVFHIRCEAYPMRRGSLPYTSLQQSVHDMLQSGQQKWDLPNAISISLVTLSPAAHPTPRSSAGPTYTSSVSRIILSAPVQAVSLTRWRTSHSSHPSAAVRRNSAYVVSMDIGSGNRNSRQTSQSSSHIA